MLSLGWKKSSLKYLARFAQAAARYIRHKSRNTHTLGEQQPGAGRGNERLSTCKRVSVSSTWPRMCTRAPTLCTNHAARASQRESRARERARDDDNNFDWCTAVILAGHRPDPNDATCHFYFALARAKSFIGDIWERRQISTFGRATGRLPHWNALRKRELKVWRSVGILREIRLQACVWDKRL